jgi:hypothetical protein
MKKNRRIVVCLMAGFFVASLNLVEGGLTRTSAQVSGNSDPAISNPTEIPGATPQVEQEPLSLQATSATTRYYHIRGADFYSVDASTSSGYASGGCAYRKLGSYGLGFPVLLPPGSVLKGIRVFYIDNDASNLSVYLVRYDDGGGVQTLATATSSGASANVRLMDSDTITEPIDLYSYSYALVFQPGVNSNLNQVCGVKVNYEWNSLGVALPFISR